MSLAKLFKRNTRSTLILSTSAYFHPLERKYCSPCDNDSNEILQDFVNRNPRSMELLRIARKPQGFFLDYPTVNFWYRLQFEKSQKYLTSWVEHHSGRKVVSASTNESAMQRHLFSNRDGAAAMNLGRVLAQRCLQAGIYEVHTDLEEFIESSQKVKLFLEALQEGGITLGEASQIREKETYPNVRQLPTFPWEVSEEDVEKLDSIQSASESSDSKASIQSASESSESKASIQSASESSVKSQS